MKCTITLYVYQVESVQESEKSVATVRNSYQFTIDKCEVGA